MTTGRASVLIAGAGNIGSHLAPLLARAGVGTVRLVDRDHVEAKNLAGQDYGPEDVGRFKAEVLAERLRRQFPGKTFDAHGRDLEDLPLGIAAVDVLLGALDSRRARQVLVSEMAWPLGVPVVDGGVGAGLLGRVQVFVPGAETACLECTWGRDDYRALAAEYPCVPGGRAEAAPTAAPAFVGSVVAGLMAAECLRILAGEAPAESREVPFDLHHHRMQPYLLRRSQACRHDHGIVRETIPLERGATADDLLAAVGRRFGGAAVRMECRRGLVSSGPWGPAGHLSPEWLRERRDRPLAALGLMPGDRVRARGCGDDVFFAVEG
jgi:molybdopterin/thiamine biosynthesis adenylyltransferase